MKKEWLVVAVFIMLKLPVIMLPIHWDAMLYVVPSGQYVAHNPIWSVAEPDYGHPPLVFWMLGAVFRLWESHIAANLLAISFGAAAVYYTYMLAEKLGKGSGIHASILLALVPLFFAQSGIINTDIAATALSLAVFYYAYSGRKLSYIISSCMLVLSKETGLFAVIAALFIMKQKRLIAYPVSTLFAWLIFYKISTGNFFYPNHAASLAFTGFLFRLNMLWMQIFQDYVWILFLIALWYGSQDRKFLPLLIMSAMYILFFSFYTQSLQRHILPVLPLLMIYCATAITRHKYKWVITIIFAVLFASSWHANPGYACGCELETDMSYVDMLHSHKEAALFLENQTGTIMTAWPMVQELTNPVLGYVDFPLDAVSPYNPYFEGLDWSAPGEYDLIYVSHESNAMDRSKLSVLISNQTIIYKDGQNIVYTNHHGKGSNQFGFS